MAISIALQKLILRFRRKLIVALNTFLTIVSFYLALGLRFDFRMGDRLTFNYAVVPLLLLLLFRTSFYCYFKLNRGYWRYVSTDDAVSLVKAHALSSLMFAAAMGLLQFQIYGFPRSLVFLEFALSTLICGGVRILVRLWCERNISHQAALSMPEKEIVVIGAGVSGHLLIKTLHSHRRMNFHAVAVFDDQPDRHGSTVHGVKVEGPINKLKDYLALNPHVVTVVVAIPELSPRKIQEIEDICQSYSISMKRLRSFEDLACQELNEPTNPITVEEILNRDVTVKYEKQIADVLSGKSVLITGAGGSIGSELVRQVLDYSPAKVVLLDKCEYNLYSIQQELATKVRQGNAEIAAVEKVYMLADIVNTQRLAQVFSIHRPHIVFHAAAYKHVPLLESNCYEAFVNNILGTRNLVRTANDFGTERFIQISTDKAVDPSSVMGATKRIAEYIVNNVNSYQAFYQPHPSAVWKRRGPMNTAIVRFGNVINSAGSVIPLFKKQIIEGGPITVTHPEMERYFMSIREAVRLLLTAGTLGDQGEVYLLDMGRPIKIIEVAKKLRALYGRRDIPIKITGMRPGEKLSEELFSHTEIRKPTKFEKVFVVHSKFPVREDVFTWIDFLHEEINDLSDQQIGSLIHNFVENDPVVQPPENEEAALDFKQAVS